MPDGYLRFDHPNVGYVLDGQEDATVRYDFERDLSEGDVVNLLTPGGRAFAQALIEDVWEAPLRLAHHDATVVDDRNHPADDAMDLYHRMRDHYPDADLDGDTDVNVIYFQVVAWPQDQPDDRPMRRLVVDHPDMDDTATVTVPLSNRDLDERIVINVSGGGTVTVEPAGGQRV